MLSVIKIRRAEKEMAEELIRNRREITGMRREKKKGWWKTRRSKESYKREEQVKKKSSCFSAVVLP